MKKAYDILNEMLSRGDIVAVRGAKGVFVVDVPYANLLDISEQQIIQEANPLAVFGFATAMNYHGLTDVISKAVYVIHFHDGERSGRLPLGTSPEDWVDVDFPSPGKPKKVENTHIHWGDIDSKWDFGVMVGYSAGLPIYVTDRERTLLDALRAPDKCGGIAKVLTAWKEADDCDLDRLVSYADRFDIKNLKQRVGYVLESLGRSHAAFDTWRSSLQRGGSVKLLASEPYSDTFSAEWNLSLNVPPPVLAILERD